MIKLEHLTRCYGDFIAVDDVSFEIKHGEIVGLLGHNGAGKTTIMKMITGYLEPTSGKIAVDNLEVGRDTRAIQKRIGYLPENCPVWPEMTVIDYLDYQASLHGVPVDKRDAAVASAIRRTVLEAKATDPIQTLSRGYRQRVGVAQAILHNPDIIILDEPTNGLDPTQIRHMRDLIADLAKTATVIVSTHILQEVQAVCERALIMRAGKLVVDARIDELQQSGGLLVTVDRNADKAFSGIPEVTKIVSHAEEGGHHHYRLEASNDAAPVIARVLNREGLQLFALQPQRRDLETIFAEVNEEVVNG
ncbi:multidrug ABC transporter ATP-binding protein [Thalassospira profundimaris]|jgi:ABC-2 type transport system ATP-binding protein|uniref:Multidrug ABC transporter ATP-binding protein n=1 Tax=Thalassospira profundimaris TaxID=502049 RepID=A0A367WHX5_9PROT|nr:ABC transporter ATP-binding protein [Thalassospira profundimaris]RCK41055.1 multidrug ABC transporter ATP-binding protein [Thalassospira profundimaris]